MTDRHQTLTELIDDHLAREKKKPQRSYRGRTVQQMLETKDNIIHDESVEPSYLLLMLLRKHHGPDGRPDIYPGLLKR